MWHAKKVYPVSYPQVTYYKEGTNMEDMKKQMRQGGIMRQAGEDQAQFFLYVGRFVIIV